METVWIAALLIAAAAILQVPAWARKGWGREIAVYSVLLLVGAGLSACAITNTELPSPLLLIKSVFGPLSKWLEP